MADDIGIFLGALAGGGDGIAVPIVNTLHGDVRRHIEGELVDRLIVLISDGGVVAYVYCRAVLLEIEDGHDARGRGRGIDGIGVHCLRIDEKLAYGVAVLALALGHGYKIGLLMTRKHHNDVLVLVDQLVPDVVAVVLHAYRHFGAGILLVTGGGVQMQIAVGVDDDLVIGVCLDHAVSPAQYRVGGGPIQINDQPIGAAGRKAVIGVGSRSCGHDAARLAGKLPHVGAVVSEFLLKRGATLKVIVIAAHKGVRHLAVQLCDGLVDHVPMRILIGVGDVTKSHDHLQIKSRSVVNDPFIHAIGVIGAVLGIVLHHILGIAHGDHGIVVAGGQLHILGVDPDLIGDQIKPPCQCGNGLACVGGRKGPISQRIRIREGRGDREGACGIVSADLGGGADIRKHREGCQLALKIIGLTVAVIVADHKGQIAQIACHISHHKSQFADGLCQRSVFITISGGVVGIQHHGDMYPLI